MSKKEVKPLDLLKELKTIHTEGKRERLAPVYIVYGEEIFIRERATQRLKQIMEKFNGAVERVTLDKIDIVDWVNSLYDISMFNPLRLVIASELSDLKDEQIVGINEKNKQVTGLIDYLKNPSPDVVLLLLSYKIDKRKKKITSVFDYGLVCESKHPKSDDLPMWIKGFATERNKSIDPEAIEFLKARYEGDLARIEKEIEKTSLYLGDKNTIRREDIEFTATGVSSCSLFDVSPALAQKNKKQVLEKVRKLLNAGESPILINATVMSRIKKLLLGYDMLQGKASDSELAGAVGVPPFYLSDFKREMRSYKREELANMYKRCMYIDSELKSARRDPEDVLIKGMLDLLDRGKRCAV